MIRLLIIIVFLLHGYFSSGQRLIPAGDQSPCLAQKPKKALIEKDQRNGPGEVFFRETFDFYEPKSPDGWSMPEGWSQNDYNSLGHRWVWRAGTDSIGGLYTAERGHSYSESPEDGFWVLPIDEYNFRDGIVTVNNADVDFQMAPVDCSDRPSVIFRMNQDFRHCCQGGTVLSMYVSNNYGAHWTEFNLRFGSRTNRDCPRNRVEINISEVAAGMPDVRIKFVFQRSRLYFWAIDDITLSEGFANDIQIDESWQYFQDNDIYDDDGFIFMIPVSQMGVDGFGSYWFKSSMINMGINDARNTSLRVEVLKNGETVFNTLSERRELQPAVKDTFYINKPFLADGIGDYRVIMEAEMDGIDDWPSNNVWEDSFHVTDSIYSICDWESEALASTAMHGNNDGDQIGVVYDISRETRVNSLSVFIAEGETPGSGTRPGMDFQYWLWKFEEGPDIFNKVLSSDFTQVSQDMLNKWVTLPFVRDGESEYISPGFYIASIQTWHGGGQAADKELYCFTAGADRSHRHDPFVSAYLEHNERTWYQLEKLPMIRLNINDRSGPVSSDVVFNVDMALPAAEGIFIPGVDFVDVAGSFNEWGGSARMTDDDGDGIYSLTVSGISTFTKIEYKYRINANWDTSEFPSGGPNRVYRTSYWNMLDDIYNNGNSTTGLNVDVAERNISVFPNPSHGQFMLDIENPSGGDLNISITSVHGKLIMEKGLKSVYSYSEKIDLSGFPGGLYLLKAGGQVRKIMLK